jgi:CDP-diacylglycerol--serine O-phosphatidyltransferase
MMVGRIEYPSFKQISWRTQGSLPRILCLVLLLVFTIYNYQWMPAVIFVAYLIYGFVRPALPKRLRREIEDPAEVSGDEVLGEGAAGMPSLGKE